jgi:GT2 family glycosyltransferase
MSKAHAPSRVLFAVPTLGTRLSLLEESLTSISNQTCGVDVVVVVPPSAEPARELAQRMGARILDDPGTLPGAINAGIALAEPHHEFVGWLADDDLLEPGSVCAATALLDQETSAVVAFGSCRYIDDSGQQLWVNRVGRWAPKVLAWGPDLVPQPGMLIRRSAWDAVDGLDESFRFAFDLDLLLKLRQIGALLNTGSVMASFRWHADSLTVGDRTTNLEESERAKRRYLSARQRRWAWLWEQPVRLATRIAAWEVNRRAVRSQP